MTWCNQVKKEEGVSCAWTDAAVHSKKDSENVAAPNTLNILNNRLSLLNRILDRG